MRIIRYTCWIALAVLPLWTAAGAETPRAQRMEQLEADLADIAADRDGESESDVLTVRGAGTPSPIARFHGNQEIHVFVGADGIPTLTNAPEAFTAQEGYSPVDLHFEPVAVSATLRKAEPAAYDTGAIAQLVEACCRRYGVDPNLVYGVIQAESGFNAGAVSPKGARGLMQLMPATAAEMGIHNLFDPAENIAGGVQYLARMMELFNGDLDRVLAAYNAGPEAVRRHNGIPPYAETRQYVQRVQDYHKAFAAGTLSPEYRGNGATHAASFLPDSSGASYVVHFQSGYTQPAERVEEQDGLYILHYHGRVDAIRKGLVAKVVRG
jgi:hypothetical protein